jgi:hypothetical protein
MRDVTKSKSSFKVKFRNQAEALYKLDKRRLSRRPELELKKRKPYSLVVAEYGGALKPSAREAQLIGLIQNQEKNTAKPSQGPTLLIPLEAVDEIPEDDNSDLELVIDTPRQFIL